jgi:hypothetical protein
VEERTQVRVVGVLTTVVWVGFLLEQGAGLEVAALGSLGAVLAVVVFLMAALDRLLWRLPGVNLLFRKKRPWVQGTWRGHVQSSWREPPFGGFLVIRQTLSRVDVRMLMSDGSSETLASAWGRSDSDCPAIFYTWRRFPSGPPQDPEPGPGFIHHGAGVIEIHSEDPPVLRGPYWTDQGRTGRIYFDHRKRRACETFEDAQRLFEASSPCGEHKTTLSGALASAVESRGD